MGDVGRCLDSSAGIVGLPICRVRCRVVRAFSEGIPHATTLVHVPTRVVQVRSASGLRGILCLRGQLGQDPLDRGNDMSMRTYHGNGERLLLHVRDIKSSK
jgi:hypothetical protein